MRGRPRLPVRPGPCSRSATRERGVQPGRRARDPRAPGRAQLRALDGPAGAAGGDARSGPRSRPRMSSADRPHLQAISVDTQSERRPGLRPRRDGITRPSRRGGSGRFLTDVIVDLGFVHRERVERGRRGRPRRRPPARARAARRGRDHPGPARPRDRRAPRARPPRPHGLQRRHGRGQPRSSPAAAKRYEAVAVRHARRAHAARRDGRPGERARRRRHRDADRHEVRLAVASAEDILALVSRLVPLRRRRPATPSPRRRTTAPRSPRSSTCASPPTTRRSSSSSTRSSPRPSSAAPRTSTSSPSEREMRVRFRIDGVLAELGRASRAAWSPASSRRVKIMADLDIAERRTAAGRPRRPDDRGPPRRPARRHAARASTASRSSCASSTSSRVELDLDHLGMRRRGARALPQAPSTRPTAPCSSPGPTGSGKSTSLYGALGRAEHAREEHHHDRGPGRVRGRGHHPGPGQRRAPG